MIPTEQTRAGAIVDLALERWESLKAAAGGALSFGIVRIFATIINVFGGFGLWSWLDLGTAVGCGFLFGITYRYAVRADRNPFLRQGVVLAFGLTRAAGTFAPTWSWGIDTAEGLVGYATAAVVLDWLLARGWVRPAGE